MQERSLKKSDVVGLRHRIAMNWVEIHRVLKNPFCGEGEVMPNYIQIERLPVKNDVYL